MPKLDRRTMLRATAGFAVLGLAMPASAQRLPGIERARLRGSVSAIDLGIAAGSADDQSREFSEMLERAAASDAPVFLPPGAYVISNVKLPARVRLSGVPGATRLVYGGGGSLLAALEADHVELSGVTLDGANRPLADQAQGLLDARAVRHLVLDNCRVTGSARNGIVMERVAGRITECEITGAEDAGIWSIEGGGVSITDNRVADCGNGGILVHRWQEADDGTLVSNNRVERIAARKGGTGPYGNGINVFRAGGAVVSGNRVTDCAFSAIRANSASNFSATGNSCLRSGETAIYSEFAFEGAVISSNIVDGAANGICIVNFNEGGRMAVCQGNLVRNLSADGPYPPDPPGFGTGIAVEADCAATGNVVENAALFGMHLGWGPYLRNVVATGNVIRDAGEGIAVSVVEGAGSVVISDNVIDGARRGAIVGHRWSQPVTGDLATGGADGYPGLTVERNRVS